MGTTKNILITGGAGFIGSHLADALLKRGHRVRVLDALIAQVHGEGCKRPSYLAPEVELIVGDVRDPNAVTRALAGIDVVFHFAARVGVGQSMYEIAAYTDTNNLGTAVVLEALSKNPVERLIVASSMNIYGEGLYRTRAGRIIQDAKREGAALRSGHYDLVDDRGELLEPIPTPETKQPALASVYALSKYDQERLCLIVGQAYGIATTALRFFNVYGPRQALSNPYTGVLAIFAARLLNRRAPVIFEDGKQRRDFVNVHDVVQSCLLALEKSEAAQRVFNIGSGTSYTVHEIARYMAEILGVRNIAPEITGQYRVGDIRHCFADISRAQTLLGYSPSVTLRDGLSELARWLSGQVAIDRVDEAKRELSRRGLSI